ncbi:MAG: methyltransferase domain-containing protein [Chitinispirillia bacterium]|jgi:2-polyprenyl-3-methyl-5-hydroxy-6-metoxy-1,4-benzoquinol methylase
MKWINETVTKFQNDTSWPGDVQEYFGMNGTDFGDLVSCFFYQNLTTLSSYIKIPEWASAFKGQELERKINEVISVHGWNSYMPVLGVAHLEIIARSYYKITLHKTFLKSLEMYICKSSKDVHMLDFGCGSSSFTQLAIKQYNLTCSLADIDREVLKYVNWLFNTKRKKNVTIHELKDTIYTPLSKHSRVKIDCSSLKGPYDIIIFADVLEHTLNPLAVLLHFLTYIKVNGFFLVNYPKYIEGDWHTPEAFFLRKWCLLLLLLTCRRKDKIIWHKRNNPFIFLIIAAFKFINPLLQFYAKRFSVRYFKKNGAELVNQVKEKAKREITVTDLLSSV